MEDAINAKFDELFKKMDLIDKKMDTFDQKLDSVEKKIDIRLVKLEQRCQNLEKKSVKNDKQNKYILRELADMKAKMGVLEQQQIRKNITIKGMDEVEKDNSDLETMVDLLLSHLHPEFVSESVVFVRRIGEKKDNSPRIVLVGMSNTSVKLSIMKNLKGKNLHNAMFNLNGKPWGTQEEKIFVGDHLTKSNNNLYYNSRQLKRKNKVKFAWTKLGQVYVKEKEDTKAVHVTSMYNLSPYIKSDIETEVETELETDTDAASTHTERSGKRKGENLSPRYTRSSTKRNKN